MSMNKIIQMGIVFLKKSKMLTFSAFLSIFVACFLSICMFQLSSNVESSFEDALSKKKGDFDIQVIKENGETFTKKEIEYLQNENGVENLTKGYWSVELEDTYIVGVMDNSLNKSLYKYSKDIKKNCIVINLNFCMFLCIIC